MPTEKPNYVVINDDGIYHDLHPVINGTKCRIHIDAARKQGSTIKAFVKLPESGATCCSDCIKADLDRQHQKEQRNLHKKFEETKFQLSQPLPKFKKNTAGKKQAYNQKADKFSFDTPDIELD